MNSKKENETKIKDAFQKAKADAEKIWNLVSEDIKEPEPLLLYQGNPVIFKNTIIMIQGKSGVHKSRLSSSLASILVCEDNSKELLGFRNASQCENLIIYCDTERNINYQLPAVIKQIISDADTDLETLKSKFAILPLMNTRRTERTLVMGEQFKELRANKTSGKFHFVIVLDIISDLVGNFNDVEDVMSLVDLINNAINTIDITFILVIHENPGSQDKARGHLGTELNNKASTVFQLSESSIGTFKLKMLKSRSTPIYGELMLRFDETVNNLVLLTNSFTEVFAVDSEISKLREVLSQNFFTVIEKKDLYKIIQQRLNWKERKIDDKLKKLMDLGAYVETTTGKYLLSKLRGKTTNYFLEIADTLENEGEELEIAI
ncbi:MAG: hypothetical protein WKF85_01395 [Chitinophagaceae bacterium]